MIHVIEIGHLDVCPPEIDEVVWIPMIWERHGDRIVRRNGLLEVVYTDTCGLPLMFHTLDLNTGFPDIKEYVRLV